MDVVHMSIFIVILFFLLVFISFPIAIALGLTTISVMAIANLPIEMYSPIVFSGISKFVLLAIPFFILAGQIMDKAGISKRLVKLIELIVGQIPGGLGIAAVICTLFWGAISGSGPATVAALGIVLIPGMIAAGYDKSFASALMAAASGVAVVIPPSIAFIVYGSTVGVAIGELFIAGILPGLVIGLVLMVYVFVGNNKDIHH